MKERITVSINEAVANRLNSRLEYGDNRSDWVERAIVEQLDREEKGE